MILISGASEGGAQYLLEGHKKGEPLGRLERDTVIPIIGSLLLLEQQEKLARDNVEYTGGNYRHATFSFSPRDMEKIDQMSDAERQKFYSDLISDFHAFYLAGYDESEYVSYAEAHRPKTKTQTNWKLGEKEKIEHIHLMDNLYGFDGRQIRFRPFSRLADDRFQRYLCEKYDLDDPKNFLVQQKPDNDRESLKHFFAEVETEADIIELCQNYNIGYRLVETKKNRYYSIQYEGKNYNLRGRDFLACQKATDPHNPTPRVAQKLTGIALEQWVLDQITSRTAEIQKRKAGKRMKPQQQEQEKPIDIDKIDIEKDTPKNIVLEAPKNKDDRSYVASVVQAAKVEKDDYFGKLGSLDPQLLLDFCRHKNWVSTKFEYSIDSAQPMKIQAKNFQNGRTSSVSLGDFLTKPNHCALSFADRVEVVEKLFALQKKRAPSPLPSEIVVSEKVADLYPANEKTGVFDRTGGFEAKKLENLDQLAEIMQTKIYSSSIYKPLSEAEILGKIDEKIDAGKPIPKYLDPKNSILTNYGYRDSAHVASHGNALFFDIDNSLADRVRTPVLTLDELSEKVAKAGVFAMIVTTKSHQKPKLESVSPQDAEKIKEQGIDMGVELLNKSDFCARHPEIPAPRSDEEGRMFGLNKVDKMRLVVFSNTRFSISKQFADPREQRKFEIQCYEKLRDDVAKHIGILANVDQSTEQDVARIYYPSGQNSIVKKFDTKGLRYFDFASKMQNIEPAVKAKIETEKIAREQKKAGENFYVQAAQAPTAAKERTFSTTFVPKAPKKEYVQNIDFQEINNLDLAEIFANYKIQYELRPEKGPEVYRFRDLLLSVTRGVDRKMLYDFKHPERGSFDIMDLLQKDIDPTPENLFFKIQKFGKRMRGKIGAFFKKNRLAVRNVLSAQLASQSATKNSILLALQQKFALKKDQAVSMNREKVQIGKHEFFYDKRDLNLDAADQQKLERISQGLPAIQPVAPTPPPPPPPAPKPQPQPQPQAEPKAQAEPAPQKKSSSDDFGM